MNVAVKKIELIEWLVQLNDEAVLNELDKIKRSSTPTKNLLSPMSSDEYKSMLDQSEKEFEQEKIVSQDELEQQVRSW